MLSIAGIIFWMIVIFSIVAIFSYGRIKAEGISSNSISGILVVAMMLVVTGFVMQHRLQNLKFISIKSNFAELDNITLIPVSYTHLDVYKRQGLKRRNIK